MRKLLLPFLLIATPALAGNYLSQEMETLRSDLESTDPARRELTLRLADLYFDLSIKDDPENKDIISDRERSLELYEEALKGVDGTSGLQGETRLKAIFQCARLHDKLNQKVKAEALFLELNQTPEIPRTLKLESALYLGELNEDKAKLKEATGHYRQAIGLCTSIDTCNFAHYRLGWTFFKETKLDEAIREIYLALWDAKGQLRDQAINDLISFMSQRQTDGKNELKEIEVIIAKSKNDKLMSQLAETFYLAGNRRAGGNVLAYINNKKPSLFNEMRLLEESYGFREWENVDGYLRSLARRSLKDIPAQSEDREEALKIHRRLVVQLDAEVDTNPDKAEFLKRSIVLYLQLWPQDEMKIKMQEGWLKVENDPDVKIQRLGQWIAENSKSNMAALEINNLRRTRLALGQKQNNSAVVITESQELSKSAATVADRREYDYVTAYELNKLKRTQEAEGLFRKIITESLEKDISDKWMILSQNLLLDILNDRKDFASISQNVELWTTHKNFQGRSDLATEFASFREIALKASFEKAVAAGDSKESLNFFFCNCRQNILVPQSCANAKVLSVKLKDQAKLVALLEMSNDEAALINEYELMGSFSNAARLREKNQSKGKVQLTDYLKVALLYELDLNFKERNRVLSNMLGSLKGSGAIANKFEKLLYVTLEEAGMIDSSVLSLGWSLPFKMKIVQTLEKGHSNLETRKVLLSQKAYQGTVWSKVVLDEMQRLDDAQRKISFYGNNSRVLFKKKVDMISRFEGEVNSYLQGADAETRIYLLGLVQRANKDFGLAIMNTPLPAEVDAEMLEQIKVNLSELAGPYLKSAEDYEKLMNDELAGIENKEVGARIQQNLLQADVRFSSFVQLGEDSSIKTSGFNYDSRTPDLLKLEVEPNNLGALSSLEKFYQTNKSERIASYFKERIQLLKN